MASGVVAISIAATILEALLGLAFLGAGILKLLGAETAVKNFDSWRLPQWFRPIVGAVEVNGAVGILVGIVATWLAPLAGIWLVGVMIGALLTHLRIHDRAQNMVPPTALLALAVVAAVLRWSDLSHQF